MLTRRTLLTAAVFAAAGLVSRYTFRAFETRWQIVIFWGLAFAYEAVLRRAIGRKVSWFGLALDAIAITVAIIAMKGFVEGQIWS